MNLLVVVIDGLHAGFLGCYGNAWIATPHINRLAAEGFLLDQTYVDRPDLDSLCQSLWTGTHVLERQTACQPPHLALQLKQAGMITTCLTDESIVAKHPLTREFDELIRVGFAAGETAAKTVAQSAEESQMASVFASASSFLATAREPFCLWLHSRGMSGPWDAPYSFREQYADEDETPPPTWTEPPRRRLSQNDDPDLSWGVCQAYAGQVSLLDECLGALFQSLEDAELLDDTLLALLGARGFPLGRNGRLGDIDQALFGELVQTPLILRFPDGLGAAARSSSLTQPCDLTPTLLDAAGLTPRASGFGRSLMPLARYDQFVSRDRIALAGESGEIGLRTPAWYLRMPVAAAESTAPPPAELYTKPDDRWEMNDVAGRCPEVVRSLEAACADLREHLATGAGLSPLDDSLVRDLR